MCDYASYTFFVFFFQAEDGIRDGHVTGVQTCALPISPCPRGRPAALRSANAIALVAAGRGDGALGLALRQAGMLGGVEQPAEQDGVIAVVLERPPGSPVERVVALAFRLAREPGDQFGAVAVHPLDSARDGRL